MNDLSILGSSLASIISLPDRDAAGLLHERMVALNVVDRIQQVSFVERGWIVREFERRHLWQYLTDPDTDRPFPTFTAWVSCSQFMGCRRTNFEAYRDMKLLGDVDVTKLIDVPKGNVKVLTKLSTAVRNDPVILDAARRLPQDEFLEKLDRERPDQHIQARRLMRFNPERSGAKIIEEWLEYAIANDLAGSRDEALVLACEGALIGARSDEGVEVDVS